MSAWLFGHDQINVLVNAWAQSRPDHDGPPTPWDLQSAGRMLLRANHDSLSARYASHRAQEEANADDVASFKPTALAPLDLVAVLHLVDCFTYQACEVDDWNATQAAKWCNDLAWRVIRKLDGYGRAGWGSDSVGDYLRDAGALSSNEPEPGTVAGIVF